MEKIIIENNIISKAKDRMPGHSNDRTTLKTFKEVDFLLNIISPTRGLKYTLKEVLNKFFERSYMSGEIVVTHVSSCPYGSRDFKIEFQNLELSHPVWNDGVSVMLNGVLIGHTTANGKFEVGTACSTTDISNDLEISFSVNSRDETGEVNTTAEAVIFSDDPKKTDISLEDFYKSHLDEILRNIVAKYICEDHLANM